MKRSTIEKKLNEAMQRLSSSSGNEQYYDGQINFHDSEASRLRTTRNKYRAARWRAEETVRKLSHLLAQGL